MFWRWWVSWGTLGVPIVSPRKLEHILDRWFTSMQGDDKVMNSLVMFSQNWHLTFKSWLVVWNMKFIFPNSWDDDPIWLSYFSGGLKPPINYYHLVMTNIAMENPNYKWRFLAGKIIYFYGPWIPWRTVTNNQRVKRNDFRSSIIKPLGFHGSK